MSVPPAQRRAVLIELYPRLKTGRVSAQRNRTGWHIHCRLCFYQISVSAQFSKSREEREKDMAKSHKPTEAKKQSEIIADQEIEITPDLLNLASFPTGTHVLGDGVVAARTIALGSKICSQHRLLDASGASRTSTTGNVTFHLAQILCIGQLHPPLVEPINLSATAESSTACYATVTYTLINQGADVQITLFAWDSTGRPASG